MIEWFVPEGTIYAVVVIVVLAIVIASLVRKQNTITTSRCPLYNRFQSEVCSKCRFLSSVRRPKRETTKREHGLNQE